MNFTTKILVVAGSVAALGACDGEPSATSTDEPSTTYPPSSTAPVDDAGNRAINAYREMWKDFATAGTSSDWQSAALGQHATGIALNKLSQSLYGDNYRGLITKGAPILNPAVSTAEPQEDPKRILITDCGDSTNWLKYRKDNGALADDKPGGRHLINAVVEKQADGSWKVSDYGVHDVGSC